MRPIVRYTLRQARSLHQDGGRQGQADARAAGGAGAAAYGAGELWIWLGVYGGDVGTRLAAYAQQQAAGRRARIEIAPLPLHFNQCDSDRLPYLFCTHRRSWCCRRRRPCGGRSPPPLRSCAFRARAAPVARSSSRFRGAAPRLGRWWCTPKVRIHVYRRQVDDHVARLSRTLTKRPTTV